MARWAVAAVLVVLLAGGTASAQAETASVGRAATAVSAAEMQTPAIVGTWIITSPGPSTRLVQTYYADGSQSSIHDEHQLRSPQLGAWSQVGERQFLMRSVSYRFDPAGRLMATVEIRGLYTVDPSGDSMTGRGVRFELAPDGTEMGPRIPWESQATRLVPLPFE